MKRYLLFLVLAVFASFMWADLPAVALAEVGDLANQCAVVLESNTGCPNMSSADCQILLQKCADYYDKQSAMIAQDLTKTSAQKNTLQNQINNLKSKIQNLDANIKQGNIMVKDLSLQISDTKVSINKTAINIQDSQDQIASILRSIYEENKRPAFIVLIEGSLSDFFSNLTYLENLNSKVSSLLDNTKNLKVYLENQQTKMSDNVDKLQKTIVLQTLQKKENEQNQKQQDQYLKLTEAQYQAQLKEKQEIDKLAAEIKNRIFQLAGVSDTDAPSFGEAVAIAKYVSGITGVRPAFLLAVLQQETGIGKNVGQCYLRDLTTGSGVSARTGSVVKNVMKPMGLFGRKGDINDFLTIIKELDKDPFNTAISCPQPSVGGYGGAMGPAQFIPTTWIGYRERLAKILGRPANPWNIRDAFLASGLYLSDLGASGSKKCSNGKSAEWGAALGYFSGTICSTNSKYAFYGNSIISIAERFEEDIRIIGQ